MSLVAHRARSMPGFTMIEVLTVAALAAVIMSLSVPLFGFLSDSREREQVRESIAAQVMAARARAVQYRTYSAVMVRALNPATQQGQCSNQRSGIIRLIEVDPRYINDPIWNRSFYWVDGRSPVAIPNGVGFVNGNNPNPGNPADALRQASTFFIVFGPDGVLRENWPVEFVYPRVNATPAQTLLNNDRGSNINGTSRNALALNVQAVIGAASSRSTRVFAIFDWRRLLEEQGANPNTIQLETVSSPANVVARLYNPATGLANDDLLCRRTFLNPYTGLGILEFDQVNPENGLLYRELEP